MEALVGLVRLPLSRMEDFCRNKVIFMFLQNKLINFAQLITFMPQEKDLNMPSLRSATLALIFSATIEQFCATAPQREIRAAAAF